MKAIEFQQPRIIRQVDVTEPGKPGPGEARVRTHRVGICGTDYSCYLGKFPFFDYPRIPGHELGVEVLDVGDGVENVRPGDRCSVEPYLNCGTCFACRRGATNCCESLSVIGVMQDGGLCEQFVIRADKLHPSSSLTHEQLALVETLGIGCHASNLAAPTSDDQVLIIGAGPIGLATLEFVRLSGAEITVMDRIDSRLEFCRKVYGVPHTIHVRDQGDVDSEIRKITSGDRFPIVIDATGHAGSMSGALSYVANTGTLVYVGVTTDAVSFPHPSLHKPELTIKASRNCCPEDFRRIIKLIEDDRINTDSWITHRTSFDNVIDEFESFTRPESGVIKAVIEVC